MSTTQVERLQSLLTRVQENRGKPRAHFGEADSEPSPRAMVAPAAVVKPAREPIMPAPAELTGRDVRRPVAASMERLDDLELEREIARPAAVPVERERATITEERVHLPDRISLPQRPAANRSVPQPEPRSSREPAAPEATGATGRKPVRDRTATPLEMAVEGELNRPAQPEPIVAPKAARSPTGQTERQMPAVQISVHAAAEPAASLSIEAEPLAEVGRPIAQVVSKHTMELDVTFGAMLKRSLSLRPH